MIGRVAGTIAVGSRHEESGWALVQVQSTAQELLMAPHCCKLNLMCAMTGPVSSRTTAQKAGHNALG